MAKQKPSEGRSKPTVHLLDWRGAAYCPVNPDDLRDLEWTHSEGMETCKACSREYRKNHAET